MDLNKKDLKKIDVTYTRMLRAILNKSWRDHPINSDLYGNIPPNITYYMRKKN